MRDGEIDAEQLGVADLRRIEIDLHRLGMAGLFAADFAIIGIARLAAGIARDDVAHAFDMLEHRLDAPEAAARKHRGFGARGGGCGGQQDRREPGAPHQDLAAGRNFIAVPFMQ